MNNYENIIETGAQLFSNLLSQNITSLDRNHNSNFCFDINIFEDCFKAKRFVYISGTNGTGKSELLMHFIANCIIPRLWKINLDGNRVIKIDLTKCNKSQKYYSSIEQVKNIILIQTDGKFNSFRLFSILETRLSYFISLNLDKFVGVESHVLRKHTKNFITTILKSLIVYSCTSVEEFILALSSCELYLKSCTNSDSANNTNMIPIFIDSIYEDLEPIGNQENYFMKFPHNAFDKYIFVLLKRLLQRFHNITLITSSNISYNTLGGYLQNISIDLKQFITNFIELSFCKDFELISNKNLTKENYCKNKNSNTFYLRHKKTDDKLQKVFKYTINNFGLQIFNEKV
jgi:hypothetical protein